MRLGFWVPLFLAVCISPLAAQASDPAGAEDILRVTIDQAKVAKVPASTATLVIGNPMIADVSMLKGGVGMVVTGKGFGQTNLIALDAQGNILDEKQLLVEPDHDVLIVQRGTERSSYSCRPWCMPTVKLGDDAKPFGETMGEISSRNGFVGGSAAK